MSKFTFTIHAMERWDLRYPNDDRTEQSELAERIGAAAVKRLVPSGRKNKRAQYYRCPNGAVLVADKRSNMVITVLPHFEADAIHTALATIKRKQIQYRRGRA